MAIGCPDKKGCRRLAAKPLVVGFVCVGKLAAPTDHLLAGVNDLQFCYSQSGRLNRWHLNRRDIVILHELFMSALEAEDKEG